MTVCVATGALNTYGEGLEAYAAAEVRSTFTHFTIRRNPGFVPSDTEFDSLCAAFEIVCYCCGGKTLKPGGTAKRTIHEHASLQNFVKRHLTSGRHAAKHADCVTCKATVAHAGGESPGFLPA
jgi:hypothetical protein